MAKFTPEEWQKKIQEFAAKFPEKAGAALEAVVARNIVKHARDNHPKLEPADWKAVMFKSIALKKKGKSTQPGGGGRWHTRTGISAQAIRGGRLRIVGNKAEVLLQWLVNWASFLEYGSASNAPYPTLRPAVDANRDTLNKRIKAALIKWGDQLGVT